MLLTAFITSVVGLIITIDGIPLRSSELAHAAPAITAEELDRYLTDKGSPLAGQGQTLMDSGRRWNVDPRLTVAIAGAETTFGTRICAEYNAWNWFYVDTSRCSSNAFDSWEDGIEQVTRGLRRPYLGRGRTTIPAIAEIYTVTERETWIRNVTLFYQAELGGDPNDLTFVEVSASLPRDLEERIRRQIEEWTEEQQEQLQRQIEEMIQRELERLVQETCGAPASMLIIAWLWLARRGR